MVECFGFFVVAGHEERQDGEELLGVEERGQVLGLDFFDVERGFAHEVDAARDFFGPGQDRAVGPVDPPGVRHRVLRQSLRDCVHVVHGVALEARHHAAQVQPELRQRLVLLAAFLDQALEQQRLALAAVLAVQRFVHVDGVREQFLDLLADGLQVDGFLALQERARIVFDVCYQFGCVLRVDFHVDAVWLDKDFRCI